jgi:hypothetical protein
MVEGAGVASAARSLTSLLGARPDALERVAQTTHVLSHRKLRVEIVRGEVRSRLPRGATGPYERLTWVSAARLGEIGLSALARTILRLSETRSGGA